MYLQDKEREVITMKERKTDKEILLEIFKRADVKIFCEDNVDCFEIEPSPYGENVGFDFDMNGNFKRVYLI